MHKRYDITAAGHICLDIIPDMPDNGITEINQLFKPGKLIQVGEAKVSTGGPVSNTGIAMTKMGATVAFMARVGDDQFGRLITDLLKKYGHTSGLSICGKEKTSYTIAIAPPGIDRIFLHNPGANDSFSSADLNEEVIARSKIFHFGYPPLMSLIYSNGGDELIKIFQFVKTKGVITSLDMALPDPDSRGGKVNWREILTRVLPFVDIFLPSIEEAFFMLDPKKYFTVKAYAGSNDVIDFIEPDEYSRLAEICLQMGSNIVALKTAHRGFYVRTNNLQQKIKNRADLIIDLDNWSNRELWCPAFYVEKIASATGSGDSSIAGFLAGFLRGEPIEKTLKYANCAGFQNLQELDAISGIKNWQETTAMIENDQADLIPLTLEKSNWQWNEEFKLWMSNRDNI